MYNLFDYGRMIADQVRTDAYAQALRQAVKPHSVVLDIGTGTGFFALLACKFGARQIYAIESSSVIQIAQEIATANDCADRIAFIQDISENVQLPEQADIIVSDLRGALPLYGQHIPTIIDARRRLLAPNGILIPKSDTLWVGVVEAPQLYSCYVAPWDNNPYQFNMETARRAAINTWRKSQVQSEQLLPKPQRWATLDYTTIENPDVSGKVIWAIEQARTAHGLSVWFESILAEGICLPNTPATPRPVYSSVFFPWPVPVNVAAGDVITVTLHANLIGMEYTWRWETCVLNQGDSARIKANFKQSTFFSELLSLDELHKHTPDYTPTLNNEGRVAQFIIGLMDGRRTLSDIAQQTMAQFSTRFSDQQTALAYVRKLVGQYSE